MSESLPFPADYLFAQRCLEGEADAIKDLQVRYRPIVVAYLRKRGASEGEAEEVTMELWTDLLEEREERRPRMATYAGKASLKTWLHPLALNRLIARKRSEEVRNRLVQLGLDVARVGETPPHEKAAPVSEAPLIELMQEAVGAGFQECAPEDFVLLHLAHVDELHYAELAKMFGCSTSKIGRDVEVAAESVKVATLRYIRKRDPWLELHWEDFLELCRVANPACFGTE